MKYNFYHFILSLIVYADDSSWIWSLNMHRQTSLYMWQSDYIVFKEFMVGMLCCWMLGPTGVVRLMLLLLSFSSHAQPFSIITFSLHRIHIIWCVPSSISSSCSSDSLDHHLYYMLFSFLQTKVVYLVYAFGWCYYYFSSKTKTKQKVWFF